ncbi:MAG: molybdopterin molybdotransferase MoeA, partial [Gammaproteobacteria bacterium]|nr:molybdopterin molybdotransferase MoeA [Gammaproteobacteria bacterium]
ALKKTINRFVYEPILAATDVPNFRNSSMDGYALNFADRQEKYLKIVGTSWAGKPYLGAVNRGECIRIFTGAYVPNECDCVVMQENVALNNNKIQINNRPGKFENIRNIASDTKQNQLLFSKGERIKAADIGLLASCGIADIAVFKPISVGFFSTGDELVALGSHPSLGQIFDSNRYTLHALLEETGVIAVDMGVIPDDPDAVEAALLAASKSCDVIITSGGVSVGEADFITAVLAKIGHVDLWKIAIKPGKPLVFGHINDAMFFGLPGNPVSVMVTYQQVVLPALRKMMGQHAEQTALTLRAICSETIKKQPGRMEFQRGIASNNEGQLSVKTTGDQGSHVLGSMSKANCLIVLEQDSGDIAKGQAVTIQLLGNNL